MTRKHFEAVAQTILGYATDEPRAEQMRRAMALDFARIFASTNPNFDRARFLAACGASER